MKLLCPYLTVDQMQTNMGDPGFSQLAGNYLWEVGTPLDGFDGLLATLAQAIADESAFLPALDSLIWRADFSAGEFAGGELDSLISLIGSFFWNGDNQVNVINSAISGGIPAVPPPNIPVVTPVPVETPPVHQPPVGGGGGYGGEPPWFNPTNPDTWGDASGGGSMIPPSPPWDIRQT